MSPVSTVSTVSTHLGTSPDSPRRPRLWESLRCDGHCCCVHSYGNYWSRSDRLSPRHSAGVSSPPCRARSPACPGCSRRWCGTSCSARTSHSALLANWEGVVVDLDMLTPPAQNTDCFSANLLAKPVCLKLTWPVGPKDRRTVLLVSQPTNKNTNLRLSPYRKPLQFIRKVKFYPSISCHFPSQNKNNWWKYLHLWLAGSRLLSYLMRIKR